MMPTPVILTTVVLIGWPAAKAVGAALSRPKWREFKTLEKSLSQEPWFTPGCAHLVAKERLDALGGRTNLIAPVIVIVGCLQIAARSLVGKTAPTVQDLRRGMIDTLSANFNLDATHPIFGDSRLWRLTELSVDLALLRDPTSGFLTVIAFLMMTPVLLFGYGTRVWRIPFTRGCANVLTLIASQLAKAEGVRGASAYR